MLGGVPDDRDDHDRDEELGQADRVRERVERVDEDLAHDRGQRRDHGERHERGPERPADRRRGVGRGVERAVPLQAAHGVDDVEHEQDRRLRDRRHGK